MRFITMLLLAAMLALAAGGCGAELHLDDDTYQMGDTNTSDQAVALDAVDLQQPAVAPVGVVAALPVIVAAAPPLFGGGDLDDHRRLRAGPNLDRAGVDSVDDVRLLRAVLPCDRGTTAATSGVAQRQRAGLITRRSVVRSHPPLPSDRAGPGPATPRRAPPGEGLI